MMINAHLFEITRMHEMAKALSQDSSLSDDSRASMSDVADLLSGIVSDVGDVVTSEEEWTPEQDDLLAAFRNHINGLYGNGIDDRIKFRWQS